MKKALACLSIFCGVLNFAKAQQIDTATEQLRVSDFVFNPLSVTRDPFTPPMTEDAKELSILERYDLDQMSILAIMSGVGAAQVMLSLPNGETHIVQVGDKLGRHKGRISKITESEIVVKETFKDLNGRMQTSFKNLRIPK